MKECPNCKTDTIVLSDELVPGVERFWICYECGYRKEDMTKVNRTEISRPSWDHYFMGLAFMASTRSSDAQTKHGCVIVSKDKHILGTGYNGFPRDIDDSDLPNLRPECDDDKGKVYRDKYLWMAHSERNALANCNIRPKGATVYVTGQCCFNCLVALYQHGVEEVVMYEGYGSVVSDGPEKDLREVFLSKAKLRIRYICPDFSYVAQLTQFPLRTIPTPMFKV